MKGLDRDLAEARQKCPSCKQQTLRFNRVLQRWDCPCGYYDR